MQRQLSLISENEGDQLSSMRISGPSKDCNIEQAKSMQLNKAQKRAMFAASKQVSSKIES
jgi:hypothetical protein